MTANCSRIIWELIFWDSFLEADGPRCFQLMRTDDPALFRLWTAQWEDLVRDPILPGLRSVPSYYSP